MHITNTIPTSSSPQYVNTIPQLAIMWCVLSVAVMAVTLLDFALQNSMHVHCL